MARGAAVAVRGGVLGPRRASRHRVENRRVPSGNRRGRGLTRGSRGRATGTAHCAVEALWCVHVVQRAAWSCGGHACRRRRGYARYTLFLGPRVGTCGVCHALYIDSDSQLISNQRTLLNRASVHVRMNNYKQPATRHASALLASWRYMSHGCHVFTPPPNR